MQGRPSGNQCQSTLENSPTLNRRWLGLRSSAQDKVEAVFIMSIARAKTSVNLVLLLVLLIVELTETSMSVSIRTLHSRGQVQKILYQLSLPSCHKQATLSPFSHIRSVWEYRKTGGQLTCIFLLRSRTYGVETWSVTPRCCNATRPSVGAKRRRY